MAGSDGLNLTPDGSTRAIDPAPHEVEGNLIFTADRLDPFYALDATVNDADGSKDGQITLDGQTYEVKLYSQESGLKPRDHPDFDIENLQEFRLSFKPPDVVDATDRVDVRSGSFHIAPRWPNPESKGESAAPSTPGDITGVNVRIDGSNLPLDAYPRLLREAMSEVGINPGYFVDDKIHEYSNIGAFEQYVRMIRDKSPKITRKGGVLDQIMRYVRTDSDQWKRVGDNGQIHGYYHTVEFDSAGAGALMDGHRVGKKVKHYQPEHVRDDPTDPLYFPKVTVSMVRGKTDDPVYWTDRDQLRNELDALLINVLEWSGISTRTRSGNFVSDACFDGDTESVREFRRVDNPLPSIKRQQKAATVEGLTANSDLNESDVQCVKAVSESGQKEVDKVAEQTDNSTRTVYRVIGRMDDLLTSINGSVGFVSEYVRNNVEAAISDLEDLTTESDGSGGNGDSTFQRWLNAHGVESDKEDGRLVFRFGEVAPTTDVKEILKSGLKAWRKSGRDAKRFRFGKAEYMQSGTPKIRDRMLR